MIKTISVEQRQKISDTRRRRIAEGKIVFSKEINRKEPIYELNHGIKVLAEYRKKAYVMCRIEAHRLFPNSKIDPQGRQTVQRSRVVMTAHLGRVLLFNEHAHHIKEDQKDNDDLTNLEVKTATDHNKHHKTGSRHRLSTIERIGESMRQAYQTGRHRRTTIVERDERGRIRRAV